MLLNGMARQICIAFNGANNCFVGAGPDYGKRRTRACAECMHAAQLAMQAVLVETTLVRLVRPSSGDELVLALKPADVEQLRHFRLIDDRLIEAGGAGQGSADEAGPGVAGAIATGGIDAAGGA